MRQRLGKLRNDFHVSLSTFFFLAHPLTYHSLQIERLKRTTTRLVPSQSELHRSNFDQVTITNGKRYGVGRL